MINNRKGFWRAKLPRFHTKPSNFSQYSNQNWYPGYLKHALSSSEIHLAGAKSLEIIGHVTNCCKRPISNVVLFKLFLYGGTSILDGMLA